MWIEAIDDAAPSEDMAGLSDGEMRRIEARIAAASALLQDKIDVIAAEVALLRPHGWKKAVRLLRELGPLATIIGIVLTFLAIMLGALYQSYSHVKEEAEFRTNTKNQLDHFDTQFVGLRALISANQPQRLQNQMAAKLVLAEARQRAVEIPVDIVEQAGGRFIEASAEAPQAWPVALEFASYRSFLNQLPGAIEQKRVVAQPPHNFLYDTQSADGKEIGLSVSGMVPANQAGRIEKIDRKSVV